MLNYDKLGLYELSRFFLQQMVHFKADGNFQHVVHNADMLFP